MATWYTLSLKTLQKDLMADPKNLTVSFKTSIETVDEIVEMARKHKRSKSQVALLLVERGLELYRKDGVLVDESGADIVVSVVDTVDTNKETNENEKRNNQKRGGRGARAIRRAG